MLPHLLVASNSISLVLIIALNLNFVVVVTGAVANGGAKVLTIFHLWMPFFSAGLCPMFYRTRREGVAEKGIIIISIVTLLFSSANIYLHFLDDLVLFMKATEVVAWGLYNGIFSISVYRILVSVVLPLLSKKKQKPR